MRAASGASVATAPLLTVISTPSTISSFSMPEELEPKQETVE
jgi:hypothetical protein